MASFIRTKLVMQKMVIEAMIGHWISYKIGSPRRDGISSKLHICNNVNPRMNTDLRIYCLIKSKNDFWSSRNRNTNDEGDTLVAFLDLADEGLDFGNKYNAVEMILSVAGIANNNSLQSCFCILDLRAVFLIGGDTKYEDFKRAYYRYPRGISRSWASRRWRSNRSGWQDYPKRRTTGQYSSCQCKWGG